VSRPTRDLGGAGTPEAAWRAAGVLDGLPRRTPDELRPPRRAVVVAPHPDDETLGIGGTLASWAAADLPTVVVAVTAGEGSHPDSPTLAREELAACRRREHRRALRTLGLGHGDVVELDLPDGDVAAHARRLRRELATLLEPGDTLVAPLEGDGHPDHDAVAAAARVAAETAGAGLLRYAVWLWHWAAPGDPGIDWSTASRVHLPRWCRDAKQDAIHCFGTQIADLSPDPRDAAVLPPPVLARLTREVEIVWGTP
jgi:LmbE family N-acetylglucosaminyl deacetylase